MKILGSLLNKLEVIDQIPHTCLYIKIMKWIFLGCSIVISYVASLGDSCKSFLLWQSE